MKKALTLGALAVTMTVLLAGCGSSSATSTKNTSSSGSGSSKTTKIVATGSTALQPLVEQAGQAYQNEHTNVTINVQGGGSGAGLSQVAKGSVNIGNSDLFAQDQKGLDAKGLVDHKVAVVGMAPVINKDANVTNVSKEQLVKIFQGKITNWKEVGGKDEKITVVNRAQGSGTRATFEKWGLDNAKVATSQEQDSNGTVQKIVSTTPGAISYLAFSYVKSDVQALSIDNVKPTEANVATNKWKIWAYEHMYTKGQPTGELKNFLTYMTSKAVQGSLVKKLGYIPLTSMKVDRGQSGAITDLK
ncbi:phosphate ABC transporter substrate-binding protein [Lactiplantibacillus paraplantarum]|uniref:Phosphate-binding protein n=1 Tax=Lactiplantibacillus paraplantarum TaxID=60520 RepID=A0A098R9H2_9LACO|nr:phosphate ABC transporter substrate-binding protein [Lactiplantibacillus paraplantarum]OAX76768.1 phosphate ABC transporter substrate-binding protein [Lactiplantibacillus plantarum]ALO03645.1 phosphate ABC transporter substrate-binding protein [Lactiplantibacillus paraplantarum]AVW09613.1 phosphate ABC transporter substrate-binding protein [Lactiplantibacillus paraplantarum]AYJ37826.1 phosphate ABC transporter substrate-binding protein [Lactiplantibacillus paraplantarum]ERL44432.1 phosphate